MEVPKRIVLDTSVAVEVLRGRKKDLVEDLEKRAELATTVVNAFELYHGAYRSKKTAANLSAIKGFLSTLDVLLVDDASAERSAEVLARLEAEGRAIDARDLLIGCVALQNGYAVLTDNMNHFNRIPDLLVVSPSEISRQTE